MNIKCYLDRKVELSSPIVVNQHENIFELVNVELPEELNNLACYIIGFVKFFDKETKIRSQINYCAPVINGVWKIDHNLTHYPGTWTMNVMAREGIIDPSDTDIDSSISEFVYISNEFNISVKPVKTNLGNVNLPEVTDQWQSLYDDLIVMSNSLKEYISLLEKVKEDGLFIK